MENKPVQPRYLFGLSVLICGVVEALICLVLVMVFPQLLDIMFVFGNDPVQTAQMTNGVILVFLFVLLLVSAVIVATIWQRRIRKSTKNNSGWKGQGDEFDE